MTSPEENFIYDEWDFEDPENFTYFGDQGHGLSTSLQTLQITIFGVLFLVGVPGNILVLTVFCRENGIRFVSSFLTVSLAIADLGVLVIFIPFYIAYESLGLVWPFGDAMCKFVFSATHICTYASLGTLILVAGERYLITSKYHVKPWAVALAVICVWALAILFCTPQLIYYTLVPLTDPEDPITPVEYACELIWPGPMFEKVLHPVDFVILFLAPLIFIATVYIKIIRLLRAAIQENVASRRLTRKSQRIVTVFLVMLVTYAICMLPIHFFHLCRVFFHDYWVHLMLNVPGLFSALAALYLLTHVTNPIIYTLLHSRFRQEAFKRLKNCSRCLRRSCKTVQPPRHEKMLADSVV